MQTRHTCEYSEPRINGAQRCESGATCLLPFVNELLRAYGHSSPGINYIVSLTPPSSVMNLRAHVNAEFGCVRDPGRRCTRELSAAFSTDIKIEIIYLKDFVKQ